MSITEVMDKYAEVLARLKNLEDENKKLRKDVDQYKDILSQLKAEREKLMDCYHSVSRIVSDVSYVGADYDH